jgi:hypothetical protein
MHYKFFAEQLGRGPKRIMQICDLEVLQCRCGSGESFKVWVFP